MSYAVGKKIHIVGTVSIDGKCIVVKMRIVTVTATNDKGKPVFVDDEDKNRYDLVGSRWYPRIRSPEDEEESFADVVDVYNNCASKGIPFVDEHDDKVFPSGDTWNCEKHDRHWPDGEGCFRCRYSLDKAVA